MCKNKFYQKKILTGVRWKCEVITKSINFSAIEKPEHPKKDFYPYQIVFKSFKHGSLYLTVWTQLDGLTSVIYSKV